MTRRPKIPMMAAGEICCGAGCALAGSTWGTGVGISGQRSRLTANLVPHRVQAKSSLPLSDLPPRQNAHAHLADTVVIVFGIAELLDRSPPVPLVLT